MSSKHSLSDKVANKVLIAVCLMLLYPSAVRAESDFKYFSQPDLDFWKAAEPKVDKQPTAPPAKPSPNTSTATTSSFPWKKYLDPKNDEFFKEGDYTPPAPFMEIARNPSDENIERWFQYLDLKNDTLRRLQTKLREYADKNASGQFRVPTSFPVQNRPFLTSAMAEPESGQQVAQLLAQRTPKTAPLRADAKDFRIRMYFDSRCPHCEKMMGTLKSLSQLGYWIELRQVDKDTSIRSRIPFPVASATQDELKQYGVENVPLVLVANLKKKTFFKIQGFQTPENVMSAISSGG